MYLEMSLRPCHGATKLLATNLLRPSTVQHRLLGPPDFIPTRYPMPPALKRAATVAVGSKTNAPATSGIRGAAAAERQLPCAGRRPPARHQQARPAKERARRHPAQDVRAVVELGAAHRE